MSLIHLILKPPLMLSHSEKAAWMSRVLSSFGKPVRDRIRVTQAESWERAAAIVAREIVAWICVEEGASLKWACGCCASGGWRRVEKS